ncbi:hypothetical protein DIPPA_20172 [Diplonema papillatum]|nr:hypothetical protein DIPPA_20172 [Diplonema papillatum]
MDSQAADFTPLVGVVRKGSGKGKGQDDAGQSWDQLRSVVAGALPYPAPLRGYYGMGPAPGAVAPDAAAYNAYLGAFGFGSNAPSGDTPGSSQQQVWSHGQQPVQSYGGNDVPPAPAGGGLNWSTPGSQQTWSHGQQPGQSYGGNGVPSAPTEGGLHWGTPGSQQVWSQGHQAGQSYADTGTPPAPAESGGLQALNWGTPGSSQQPGHSHGGGVGGLPATHAAEQSVLRFFQQPNASQPFLRFPGGAPGGGGGVGVEEGVMVGEPECDWETAAGNAHVVVRAAKGKKTGGKQGAKGSKPAPAENSGSSSSSCWEAPDRRHPPAQYGPGGDYTSFPGAVAPGGHAGEAAFDVADFWRSCAEPGAPQAPAGQGLPGGPQPDIPRASVSSQGLPAAEGYRGASGINLHDLGEFPVLGAVKKKDAKLQAPAQSAKVRTVTALPVPPQSHGFNAAGSLHGASGSYAPNGSLGADSAGFRGNGAFAPGFGSGDPGLVGAGTAVRVPETILRAARAKQQQQQQQGGRGVSWAQAAKKQPHQPPPKRAPAGAELPTTRYFGRVLFDECRRSIQHVATVEKAFAGVIRGGEARMLPPMNKRKRSFIHELALHYGLSVQSVDKEPNRSCYIRSTASAHVPRVLLSNWYQAKRRTPPDTVAEAHLATHPDHAIVFPSVPLAVTPGYFNTLFQALTGQFLVLRRKPAASARDPARACVVVFLSGKSAAASDIVSKSSCSLEWAPYASWKHRDRDQAQYGKNSASPADSDEGELGREPSEDDEENGTCSESSEGDQASGSDAQQKNAAADDEQPQGSPSKWNHNTRGPTSRIESEATYSDQGWVRNTFSKLKTKAEH